MNEQPEALRLADWIESPTFGRTRPEGDMHRAIAAELRRLHAVESVLVPGLERTLNDANAALRATIDERDALRAEVEALRSANDSFATASILPDDKAIVDRADVEALRADAERYRHIARINGWDEREEEEIDAARGQA